MGTLGPLVVWAKGYFPGVLMGGEDMPGPAYLEWTGWCMTPGFLFDDATLPERANFARLTAPLRCIQIADDPWGTQAAVAHMAEHFTASRDRSIWRVTPADAGVAKIGHFGFFRPDCARNCGAPPRIGCSGAHGVSPRLRPPSPLASAAQEGLTPPHRQFERRRVSMRPCGMALKDPTFTIGIEEEYLLVDQASRDLVREMPQALFEPRSRPARPGGARVPEIADRGRHRRAHDAARRPAPSLHPAPDRRQAWPASTAWRPSPPPPIRSRAGASQQPTERERYQAIAQDLAGVGRRLVICGMHVHVGIEDDELRIDLMNQARYFLPHLLVLSTSSPFAEGEDTGLKCYRLAAYQELPRTGLPGRFESWEEYRHTVDLLVRNGIIEDASKIWWDLRPSPRFPTLEMRITDVCTRLEDAVCVAAMYVSILRMLYRIRRANQTWRSYPLFLLSENRWRAQRYGVAGTLFDFGKGELVRLPRPRRGAAGAAARGCRGAGLLAEVEHARTIVAARHQRRPAGAVLRAAGGRGRLTRGGTRGRGRSSDRGDAGAKYPRPVP